MKKVLLGAALAIAVVASVAFTCNTTTTTATAAGTLVESCALNRAAPQAVNNGVLTFATWDSVRPVSPSWCVPGASVVIPADGIYAITFQSAWALGNVTGHRFIHVERAPAAGGNHEVLIGFSRPATEEGETLSSAWAGSLTAGDQIRVALYQDSGVNITWGGANRSPGNPITSSLNAELDIIRFG